MPLIPSLMKCIPAALIGIAATTASADVTTSITTSIPNYVPATNTLTTATLNIAIPQFNSSLGTLTGVTVQVILPTQLNVNITSTFSTPTFVTVTPSFGAPTVKLTQPSPGTAITFNSTPAASYSGTSGVTGDPALTIGTIPVSVSGSYAVASGDLASFIGTGTTSLAYTLTEGGFSGFSAPIGASPSYKLGSVLGGSEMVTYTYTPSAVPEPASLSLIGVAGLALLRRRR